MAPTRAASIGNNRVVLGQAPGPWFFSCIVTPGLPLKPYGPQFPMEKGEDSTSPLFLQQVRSKQAAHPAAGVARSLQFFPQERPIFATWAGVQGGSALSSRGVLVFLSPGVGQGGCLPDLATEAPKSCLRCPLPFKTLRSGMGGA